MPPQILELVNLCARKRAKEKKEKKALFCATPLSANVPLSDLTCLRMKETQIHYHNGMGKYKSVASVYVDEKGDLFNLHPELVTKSADGITTTSVCKDCVTFTKANKLPPLSVANGLDFGDLRHPRPKGGRPSF